ncbi:hypothetical protein DR950_16875 [Kitasatospora xanthocidica]|uniref:Uncharacterized protein n=1 Tax=Kitasatospora xanthocidica TaxID=83382 RepID=A0A372ZVI3_9ACTN|nr:MULTISPECIES: hypothetical protein [Streptomycetaceae]OKI11204.1 hypothetical protein AMK13_01830 [Streptomyces sp. CB02056]RGD59235.1 hypothetical protein DR950_16875 [Kitasatospora xanthocidica]
MPRTSRFALAAVVLALVALVVSLVQGFWLGLIWLPLAGVASNVLWMDRRRARIAAATAAAAE